jgi:phosphoglycolate phosphatase-like HAD superfamily hydrolase
MKAVGFDLDGTLIDSTDAIVASFMHAFDALRRPSPPRDTIVSTISLPLEHQFRLLGVTNVTEAAARAAGAACWAVTTGYHSREELEGAAADRIFDSIADVAKSVLKGGRWVT